MKFVKILVCTLVVCLLVAGFSTFSYAKDTSSVSAVNKTWPTRTPEKQRLIDQEQAKLRTQKLESIRARIEDKRATVAAKLEENRKERIRTFFGIMTTRFKAAITRLTTLITRIEARLVVIKTENPNLNTAAIESDITKAKDLLTNAQSQLAAITDSLEDVLAADNPKEAFSVISADLAEVKQTLIETHRLLVKVIGNIKGLRVAVKPTVTATP